MQVRGICWRVVRQAGTRGALCSSGQGSAERVTKGLRNQMQRAAAAKREQRAEGRVQGGRAASGRPAPCSNRGKWWRAARGGVSVGQARALRVGTSGRATLPVRLQPGRMTWRALSGAANELSRPNAVRAAWRGALRRSPPPRSTARRRCRRPHPALQTRSGRPGVGRRATKRE